MWNRREFVAAATGLAAAAFGARVLAADERYDLVIKGGRVIDPSLRLDAIRDVGVAQGRIAAVERSLTARAGSTIDARGKLVVPGLIDIHTHAARTNEGPGMVLADGVTGWIDAGSYGADDIAAGLAVARASPQQGRLLINVGRKGIIPEGDTTDLANADVGLLRETIAAHRDLIVGIKCRLSKDVTSNDVEVLRRAQEVATPLGLPVMIHMGQTASPLPRLLDLLKPGDIVTHLFAPPPNAIIDDAGHILPAVLAARRRGVVFDVGNGRVGHMRWDVVEKIMNAGFWPDTFSTDWNADSKTTGVVDLPNCMSKLFGYGMSVSEAIACATVNAARTFPVFRDRGTLNVGAVADVTLLELREGEFEFLDNYDNKRKGRQRLVPAGTVLAGRRV
ncbi:MAG TPA: amidohydrolase family protein [Gammaproteobacteria bacterium]|jgi:dihydroorotase|nr:amidohydrolase family protein [Gammaproteobacteria bacterium]